MIFLNISPILMNGTRMQASPSIGVVVLTLNAAAHLPYCLPPLLNSSLKPRILVVDSTSNDESVAVANQLGAEIVVIPREEFNHGLTREKARRILQTDIIVFFTPDAYAVDPQVLEKLIQPIKNGDASIAYARQLPRKNASFFESFPRKFNYPLESHIRGIENVDTFGAYIFFCSNSCAAYSANALDEIGGFPKVLLGEDTVVTAKLLKKGHKIAYVAEAQVYHSHAYTLWQEFQRYFDTGCARKDYQAIIESGAKDEKRGTHFVKEMMTYLFWHKPHLLPYALANTLAKWLGYRLGKISERAPIWFKKKMSSQPYYWTKN